MSTIPATPPTRPDVPASTDVSTDAAGATATAEADGGGRRTGMLALGAALLGVAAVLALVVRRDVLRPPFQGLDERWHAWMGGPHEGLYSAVATVLNLFGGPAGSVVPLALLAFLLIRRRWVSAGFLFGVYMAGNMLVIQGLKHLVDRPRPANPLVRVDHGSFPSGHAAGAALLVVIVGALLVPASRRRAWWVGGAVFTLAMMWSRTWLHAHWLSDTAAGAAAGAGAGLLAWWLCAPALAREARRAPGRRHASERVPAAR